MAWFSVIPVVGKIFDGLFGVIDQAVEDKDEANKLKAQLEQVFKNADLTKFTEQIRAQKDIIVAEAQSESWIARTWRPIVMLFFAGLVGAHWLGCTPPNLAEAVVLKLLAIVQVGIGGYVIGRTAEKCVKHWKNGGKK